MSDNFYKWSYWYIIAIMLAASLNKASNSNKAPESTLLDYQHLIDMAINNNPKFLDNIEKQIKEAMN